MRDPEGVITTGAYLFPESCDLRPLNFRFAAGGHVKNPRFSDPQNLGFCVSVCYSKTMKLSKRQKLRQKIMFWLEEKPWWLDVAIAPVACLMLGHHPIGDQCGNPDHDFCAWCMKSMPGKAETK